MSRKGLLIGIASLVGVYAAMVLVIPHDTPKPHELTCKERAEQMHDQATNAGYSQAVADRQSDIILSLCLSSR